VTKYMTWLVPAAGPERDRLAAVISGLAAEHEAPVFEPHVTLTDPVESDELSVLSVLQPMLSGRAPIEVTLSEFGHEQVFFRSLYLSVEPSEPLTALNDAARQGWEQILPPYRPHLSLLYADLPADGKDAIAGGLDLDLPMTIRLDAVELWADDDKGVASWRRIARLLFPG
jgi:2'-5' RNA ligase